jgi:hypothetical protein
MLGQAQTTSLFFQGKGRMPELFHFHHTHIPLPYKKKGSLMGVKDTEMGSRMTGERQGKGMDNEKGAACTPEQTQAVSYMAKIRLRCFASWYEMRLYRALILCQCVYQVEDKGC